MSRFYSIAAAISLCVAFAGEANADCAPLAIITSVDLTPASDHLAEFVPVSINGTDQLLLLDTGGAITELTAEAADAMKLERRKGPFQQYNVSGQYSDQYVNASLTLGALKSGKSDFVVAPGSNPFGTGSSVAGILGPDILAHYDLHIDFGANKLTLLSPDHCEGKVIYWPASAVVVVPMKVLRSGHIIVPVSLDGKTINALIDTGASNTTLTTLSAESDFGLKLGDADTPKTGNLPDQPGAFTYKHTFKSLAFEGIAVSNPHVDIIPDMTKDVVANNPELGTRLADTKRAEDKIDMLLGMNVLRHFHLYVAYKEEKLYITPIEAPAAAGAGAH